MQLNNLNAEKKGVEQSVSASKHLLQMAMGMPVTCRLLPKDAPREALKSTSPAASRRMVIVSPSIVVIRSAWVDAGGREM